MVQRHVGILEPQIRVIRGVRPDIRPGALIGDETSLAFGRAAGRHQ